MILTVDRTVGVLCYCRDLVLSFPLDWPIHAELGLCSIITGHEEYGARSRYPSQCRISRCLRRNSDVMVDLDMVTHGRLYSTTQRQVFDGQGFIFIFVFIREADSNDLHACLRFLFSSWFLSISYRAARSSILYCMWHTGTELEKDGGILGRVDCSCSMHDKITG